MKIKSLVKQTEEKIRKEKEKRAIEMIEECLIEIEKREKELIVAKNRYKEILDTNINDVVSRNKHLRINAVHGFVRN